MSAGNISTFLSCAVSTSTLSGPLGHSTAMMSVDHGRSEVGGGGRRAGETMQGGGRGKGDRSAGETALLWKLTPN